MNNPAAWLPLREVVAPADQAAVVETIRSARSTATPVYPLGGGVHAGYGARPKTPGVGLALSGMNRLVDYPARDLTITVEAGTTFAQVAQLLAAEGQRLPVDVAFPERATVGGVLAAAPIGPRHYRFGSIREFVLGLTAVDGTGMTFSAGGRVVKNATGYDLCRLMTGGLGALGVLTQVTLMVRPAAESTAWVACDLPDPAAAEPLLAALVRSRALPSAIELFGGPAWRNGSAAAPASEGTATAFAAPRAWRLAVGLEGAVEEVDAMIHALAEEWRPLGCEPSAVLRDAATVGLWTRLTEFPRPAGTNANSANGANDGNGDTVTIAVEARVLPGRVVEAIQAVLRADAEASVLAHAGSGVVAAELAVRRAAWAMGVGRLRAAVASLGGFLIVTAHPASCELAPADVWGPAPPGAAVMEAIRRQFDPENILNPGRRDFGGNL